MIEYLILSQLIGAFITLVIGVLLLLVIRKKTSQNTKQEKPAGFWVRVICLSSDLAIVNALTSFLAYRGSLASAGQISVLITLGYFFFSWLFFAATPTMMLVRIRIISQNGDNLKMWQVLTRLGLFLFLFIGWIPVLFDKKEKKALHDIVAKTRVAYAEKELKIDDRLVKKTKFVLLGLTVLLLIGLIIHGLGEKLTKYKGNDQVKFFDLNKDGIADGLTIDLDKDGKADVFKYDLNNDNVVDFTTFDADKDSVAESIDVNNDGHIDGFDFDNDNKIDAQVFEGQFFIWLWRFLFGMWTAGFAALIVFAILKENKTPRKQA